jgi:hypothetical protein
MALEAAKNIKGARNHLDHIAVACQIAGEHALFTEPFRTSSHDAFPLKRRISRGANPLDCPDVRRRPVPLCGIIFHLRATLPQAICGDNTKLLVSFHS